MKFRIRYADQVVGVFILFALLMVVVFLFFIALNQRLFTHNYVFESRFTSANSLSVGTGISFRGFEIGKITKMKLNKENLVDIEFTVYEEYIDRVTKNSVLELSTSPIGLGNALLFHRGLSDELQAEKSFVPSLDIPQGKELVAQNLVDIPKKDDTIARLLSGINELVFNINETVVTLNLTMKGTAKGPIRDVFDNLNGSLAKFFQTLDWLQVTFGPVGTGAGTMIGSVNQTLPSVMTQLDQITANLKATTDAMRDPTGLVPKLLGDDKLMTQIDSMLAGLNRSVEDIQKITSGISAEVPKLSSTLLETRAAIATAQEVMEGLKNNPLLKGGISDKVQQQAVFQTLRKEEF